LIRCGFGHCGSTAIRARLPPILTNSLAGHRPLPGHQTQDRADAHGNDDFDDDSFKEGCHRTYSCLEFGSSVAAL
jgi:hypothetical protein